MPLPTPWERIPLALRELPLRERVLPALLELQAEAHGDRPLLRIGSLERSFREMRDAVAARAGALLENGIAPGDRVAIMAPNRSEVLDLVLACSWSGAVPVLVNVALRGAQLEHVLRVSGATTLATEPELAERLDSIDAGLERVWLLDAEATPMTRYPHALLPAPARGVPPHPAEPGDCAAVVFTSGTSGPPKGVVCGQTQLFWWGVNTGWNLGLSSDDVLYTCLPLFHTNALSTFVQALVFGAACEIGPHFSASRFWARIADSGATATYLLGAMVSILMSRPPDPADRRHRVRIALAPATPAAAHAAFESRFGVTLLEAYGSSETNHVIGALPDARRPGTMGRVLPGFDARVVDELDGEVPDGEPGELLLRADEPFSFAGGYFGMPETTVEVWRNLWFHSGDRVIRDRDGYFTFVDRLTDSIRRRGENVSAYEVEQALLEHDAVRAVAVFAVPSELGEDDVMATVVLAEGADARPLDLIRHCGERLAYFAVPRYVDFADELPTTENGKVRKVVLRERGVSPATWDRELSSGQLR